MRAKYPSRSGRKHLILASLSLGVLLIDQLTKLAVKAYLPLGESFPEDWPARLTHVQNTGIAFGLKANPLLLISLTLGVVIVLLTLSLRHHLFSPGWVRIGLGLMLGGAVGNLLDRILFGYVTDFFDLRVWPVFNVADSAVVVGMGILAYFFLFHSPTR